MKTILLASQSPRRAELLAQCGIPFEFFEADHQTIENAAPAPGPDLGAWVEQAALAKLNNILPSCNHADALVICADTIVEAGGEVMGKPVDTDDARRMLRKLSGRAHRVLTGVAIADTCSGNRAVFHETTTVEFRKMDDAQIDRYIASGEPADKAGAYGIQGLAGGFVRGISGCHSNVVGLPVSRLAELLNSNFGYDFTRNWHGE